MRLERIVRPRQDYCPYIVGGENELLVGGQGRNAKCCADVATEAKSRELFPASYDVRIAVEFGPYESIEA